MTRFLIELAVRIVIFTGVFAVAVWRSDAIRIERRWAIPLVGLVFGLLNTGLYWLLKPVLNIATFGLASWLLPFVLNAAFLWATGKLLGKLRVKSLEIDGLWITIKLAIVLTLVHGGIHLALDALMKS
jgi:uncharacterized membrane protein YvlD (DUF360 family)